MRCSDSDREMQAIKETGSGEGLNVGMRAGMVDRQFLFNCFFFILTSSYVPPLSYSRPLKFDPLLNQLSTCLNSLMI